MLDRVPALPLRAAHLAREAHGRCLWRMLKRLLSCFSSPLAVHISLRRATSNQATGRLEQP